MTVKRKIAVVLRHCPSELSEKGFLSEAFVYLRLYCPLEIDRIAVVKQKSPPTPLLVLRGVWRFLY